MTRPYQTNSTNSTNQQQQRKDWNPEALTSVFENGTLQKRPHRRAQEAPHIRQLDYLFHGRNTIMLSSHGVDPSVILDPAYPFVNPSDPETNQNSQTTSFSTNNQPHQRHNSKKQASFRKEYCIQNIIPTSEIQKPKTPIGHGGFGQVYRAIRKQQIPSHNDFHNQLSFDTIERQVAIKEHNSLANLKDRSLDERMKILRDIVEEARVHRDYKHEYIIGLEGFWLDDEAFTRDYEDWTNSKNESDRTQKYHCESPFAYPKLSIVLEYAAGGSLFYYLKQKNSVTDNVSRIDLNQESSSATPCQQHKLSPDDLINWTKQVVGATKFLHDKYLIHCDIKSHNVLLSLNTEKLLEQYGNDQGSTIKAQLFNQEIEPTELEPNLFTLKLTDFGTAKIIERDGKTKTINKPQSGDRYYNSVRTVEHKLMGTGAWMAPELFKAISSQENSKASDIWALGVLLWEILTGRQPYQGIEHIAIGMWVCHEGQKLIIPGYAPAIFQEILRKCWGKLPKDRISAQEIIEKIDEFNISEYDSYRTINVLDYQEQLQQASDLLLERSQSLDLEQDKIKWRADILTVREEQFETEKINFKKLQDNLVLEQRKTHAKEDLIRLLTTSEHYTKQQIVTDKMKKFRKVLAKRIRKNKIKIEVDHSKFKHLPGTEDFAKFQADSDYKPDRLGNLKNVPNSGHYGNSGTYGTPSSFSMDRSGNEDIMSSKSSSSNYHYRTKPNSPKVAGVPGNMMAGYDNRLNPLHVPTASIPPYTSNSSGYHQNNSSMNGSIPRHAANSTSSNVQVTQSSETIQSPSSTHGVSNSVQNSIQNTYSAFEK